MLVVLLLQAKLPGIMQLLGVKLDDQLFLHGHRQLFTSRQTLYDAFQLGLFKFEPLGNPTPDDSFQGFIDILNIFALLVDHDFVTDFDHVGWDIHPCTVDDKMIVADKMSALITGIAKTKTIYDVVQASFQHHQQIRTGNPFLAVRFFKKQMELLFGKPVNALDLLLFTQLDAVVRSFPPAPLTMLARSIASTIKSTFVRIASVPFEEQL